MFTQDQFLMAVRWALNLLGGFLMTHGYISDGFWEPLSGLVISAVPFIWGLFAHSKVGTILAAQALPEVQGVITTATPAGAALADSVPSPQVVPAGTTQAAAVAKA